MKILKAIKKHKKLTVFVFVLLLALFIIFRPRQDKPLAVQEVKRGDVVVSVSTNGTVAAKRSVNLSFQISGKLSYLGVKKGDFVYENQAIAALDQRTAQKNLEVALKNYSEQRNTFEQIQDNYQDRAPDQALNDAMKRVLQNNQYDLDKAVLSVELQDLVKEQSVLTTPISGIVTRADIVLAGAYVSSSTIFAVSDPTSMVFDMEVDEADIGKVAQGQIAKVILDAYQDKVFSLPVSYIDFASHITSTSSTAYTVEVNLPNDTNFKFRMGMSGEGEIIIEQVKDTIYIPSSSIFDKNYVYIKTKKELRKKEIVTGLQNDTQTQVIRGLSVGDMVVIEPTSLPNTKTAGLSTPFLRRIFR